MVETVNIHLGKIDCASDKWCSKIIRKIRRKFLFDGGKKKASRDCSSNAIRNGMPRCIRPLWVQNQINYEYFLKEKYNLNFRFITFAGLSTRRYPRERVTSQLQFDLHSKHERNAQTLKGFLKFDLRRFFLFVYRRVFLKMSTNSEKWIWRCANSSLKLSHSVQIVHLPIIKVFGFANNWTLARYSYNSTNVGI